jgi:murein DD-endopeptidase MepM/ murein hydrolase activator NlpD
MKSVSKPLRGNSTWRILALLLLCVFSSVPVWAKVSLEGDLIQGGMLIGSGAKGAKVWQDGDPVRVSESGTFLIGFGRDAPATSQLKIVYADGNEELRKLTINRRDYRIQRIDGLPQRKVTPRSEEDLKRIRDDVVQLKKARARNDAREDFLSGFMWPAQGPISGVYGSQRILNGKPRRPHFGVDIARPTGTPVVAPADGIISLAHPDMFFSGGTLLIDHGHQLSSAFLHLSRILVEVGQKVKKGETVAEIGATGRVTGPHLDWRMHLREHRIDPQLLVPPMPVAKK